MPQKITTEEIIKRFKNIHGDKYDYSNFEYVNAHTKGKIICPKHGEFYQSSNVHLKGTQCPKCAKENVKRDYYKLTKNLFLQKANIKHNNKYTYNLTDFKNTKSIINIKCPIHGWFEQNAIRHLHGQGCPKCGNINKRDKLAITHEEFIERANIKHNNKFDYSLVDFKTNKDYVKIICPIHGIFEQRVDMHLNRNGCPKCTGKNRTKEEFIQLANKIHGNKYDYSMSEYINSEHKIKIKCNKCGTIFQQKPWVHLKNHGCPHCKMSKGELIIENILNKYKIEFIPQYKTEWLKKQSIDFYIPKYNIAIEVQGEQHLNPNKCFGKKELYNIIVNRDKIKYKLCKENGINIIYFTLIKNLPNGYIDKIYNEPEELITDLMNKNK